MMERPVDVFFYGLFMDADLLLEKRLTPVNPRPAYVEGFQMRIGGRAMLLPQAGARAYGMLFALRHSELDRLYFGPGLELYRPEPVLARTLQGEAVPALCYNLPEAPSSEESSPEYRARLRAVLRKLNFPESYIAALL